jgi:hypothetical protein
MSTNQQEIFDKIVLVNVDNAIWSGYKRTTDGDLAKMNASLPGDGIITKGGKKIFPTETLKPFNTLKKEISRKLMSVGVSALGGSSRVVPVSEVKDLEKFLATCEAKYNSLLADFANDYDVNLSNHLNAIKTPVVREIVERSVLKVDEAVGRFRFLTDIFTIVPKGDGEGLVNNLANKLFTEVSTAARDAYEKSFQGKPRVGQRALNQVVAIRNKMAGLSMLDGKNIQPIIDSINDVLGSMPDDGWIEGVHYSALIGLVNMLCDPEDMLKHAEKVQQGIASSAPKAAQPIQETLAINEVVETIKPVTVEAKAVQATLTLVETPVVAKQEDFLQENTSAEPLLQVVDKESVQDITKADKPLPIVTSVTTPVTKPVAKPQKAAAFF